MRMIFDRSFPPATLWTRLRSVPSWSLTWLCDLDKDRGQSCHAEGSPSLRLEKSTSDFAPVPRNEERASASIGVFIGKSSDHLIRLHCSCPRQLCGRPRNFSMEFVSVINNYSAFSFSFFFPPVKLCKRSAKCLLAFQERLVFLDPPSYEACLYLCLITSPLPPHPSPRQTAFVCLALACFWPGWLWCHRQSPLETSSLPLSEISWLSEGWLPVGAAWELSARKVFAARMFCTRKVTDLWGVWGSRSSRRRVSGPPGIVPRRSTIPHTYTHHIKFDSKGQGASCT